MFLYHKKTPLRDIFEGSHKDHWQAFYGAEKSQNIVEKMTALLDKNDPIITTKEGKYEKHIEHAGGIDLVLVAKEGKMLSYFLTLLTDRVLSFETKEIFQWNHSEKTEAQISGMVSGNFPLKFFATDYLENKKQYQKEKEVMVHLSGLAYEIRDAKTEEENADFCVPSTNFSESDVYDFRGEVSSIRRYEWGETHGFLLALELFRQERGADFLPINVFVNVRNLKSDQLKKGMRIEGSFWLHGCLEKEKS